MTDCGTWVPPGPSKKAIGRPSCSSDRAGKRARSASTSKAVIVVLEDGAGVAILAESAGGAGRVVRIVALATIEPVSWRADDCPTARPRPARRHAARCPRATRASRRGAGSSPPTPASSGCSTRSSAPSTTCRSPSTTRSSSSPRRPAAGCGCTSSRTAVLLSRSGVTRLIDRLVRDGSVERDPCVTDARGAEAVLTAGRPRPAADRVADPPPRHRRPLRRGDRAGRLSRRSTGRCATSSRPSSPSALGGATARGVTGRLYVGTSGFAYPDWSPRFYPAGLKGDGLLRYYALAPRRVRAEQHVLPAAEAGEGRRLARRDAAGRSGSRSRPSAAARSGRSRSTRARACRG